MDLCKIEEAQYLLNTLNQLNNIKLYFFNTSYPNFDFINLTTERRLLVPQIIEDKLKGIVEESIKEVEKQIEEL